MWRGKNARNGWWELGFPQDMWPAFLDGISIRCQSTAAANFLVKLLSAFNVFLRYSTFRYVKRNMLASVSCHNYGIRRSIQRIRIYIINRWTATKNYFSWMRGNSWKNKYSKYILFIWSSLSRLIKYLFTKQF